MSTNEQKAKEQTKPLTDQRQERRARVDIVQGSRNDFRKAVNVLNTPNVPNPFLQGQEAGSSENQPQESPPSQGTPAEPSSDKQE